jgi:hypothetical protein
MRRLTLSLLFGLVVYAVLAGISTQLVDLNRQGCERGNAARLGALRDHQADEAQAKLQIAIYEQRGIRSEVFAWNNALEAAEEGVEALIESAAETGFQTTYGGVTISCAAASPSPLPWFGS